MKTLFFIISLLITNSALADITINKYSFEFKQNEKTKQKTLVKNNSKNKAFIEVILRELELKDQKITFTPIENKNNSLIISPNKFILQPSGSVNSEKNINIININKELKEEKIYKISFVPRLPKNNNENAKNLKINFVLVYEAYIYVTPKKIIKDYNYKVENNVLHFENKGNSSIILKQGKSCINEICSALPKTRIISKRILDIDINKNSTNSYVLEFSDGSVEEIKF